MSLKVLNVSGNNLDSVREFSAIQDLHQFMANDNSLSDMKEIASLLCQWSRLSRLELEANPICQKAKYRDRIIIMSNSLSRCLLFNASRSSDNSSLQSTIFETAVCCFC